MEIIGPILLLGFLFILFGGLENRDNKSDLGKETIAGLEGTAKVVQENGAGCFLWGGLLIIVLIVIVAIASGEKLW